MVDVLCLRLRSGWCWRVGIDDGAEVRDGVVGTDQVSK